MADATKLDTDLLAELTEPPRRYNAGCGVGDALAAMDDKTRATFEHALSLTKDEASNVRIADALCRLGFDLSTSTVGRHRRSRCKCDG